MPPALFFVDTRPLHSITGDLLSNHRSTEGHVRRLLLLLGIEFGITLLLFVLEQALPAAN